MAHHHHSGSASIINADLERHRRSNEAVARHKKRHQKDLKLFKQHDVEGRLKAIQEAYGEKLQAVSRNFATTATDVVMGQVIPMPVLSLEDAARENITPITTQTKSNKKWFSFLPSRAAAAF